MNFLIRITILFVLILGISFDCISQGSQILGDTEGLSEEPTYYSLRKALRSKTTVKKLDLSNQQLSEFPTEIFELKNLVVLYLDSNQIKVIPDQIGDLKELVAFSASNNEIVELPQTIEMLYQLQYLYLNNNKIRKIQPELCRLHSLLYLNLGNNKIDVLPPEIRKLGTLKYLKIDNNQLKEIPKEIRSLYDIKDLNLSNNFISDLPAELFELKQLEELYMYNNQVISIHPNIKNLRALRTLSLSRNKLSTFPETFFELFNLKTLYLDSNQILNLPLGLSRMLRLEILDLSDNTFTDIPPDYNKLKALKKLYLRNNKLTTFPQVLYDIQNNNTKIKGVETKELYKIRLLFSKARNKRLTKQFNVSITRYKEILSLDTNNIKAMIELASTYLDTLMYDSALAVCENGLKKNPTLVQLKELKILHNYSKNKTNNESDIVASYEKNIKEIDDKSNAYFDLGLYYFNKEEYEKASKQFEETMRINSEHNDAHFYYAVTAEAQGNENAFVFAALRFLITTENDLRTKTILPFLMIDFEMETGNINTKDSVVSTTYSDNYLIKNNEGEVIYSSASPTADLLSAMLSGILRSDKVKEKNKAIEENLKNILDPLLNKEKNNVEKLKHELDKLCKNENLELKESEFYYSFYLPYFKEMKDKGYIEAFSYLINNKRKEEEYIESWLKENETLIHEFQLWSEKYSFNQKTD